jgi:hypothetical protein
MTDVHLHCYACSVVFATRIVSMYVIYQTSARAPRAYRYYPAANLAEPKESAPLPFFGDREAVLMVHSIHLYPFRRQQASNPCIARQRFILGDCADTPSVAPTMQIREAPAHQLNVESMSRRISCHTPITKQVVGCLLPSCHINCTSQWTIAFENMFQRRWITAGQNLLRLFSEESLMESRHRSGRT